MSRAIRNTTRLMADFILKPIARRIANLQSIPRRLDAQDMGIRMLAGRYMQAAYPDLVPPNAHRHAINEHEYRAYSQHGEDGILLFLFSKIGMTNRRFVEFGVEDGTECNAANLAINFGFTGLLMDGDADNVASGHRFYRSMLGDSAPNVRFSQSWITAENINQTIREHGVEGEIDLLSVDIDGSDYWVLNAIDAINPRVIVLEYNAALGPDKSIAIPYNPQFERLDAHPSGFYYGASLTAYTKLCTSKGYRLVGCESSGVNAFFVRKDLADGVLQSCEPNGAYYPKATSIMQGLTTEEQFDLIRSLPFIEV